MAFEVPYDLINHVQILLRNEAHVSSYDPHDSSLPNLPSSQQSISELDPSPPYLRCKQCQGRLLRGIQSLICVYCGHQQNKEIPPDPINFRSTSGYRWLLDSLNLQDSETVGPSTEALESNRRQNTPNDEISLSDLLDLEIKWAADSEKVEDSVQHESIAESKSPLNLAGVDIANFFPESKSDTSSNVHGEQLSLNKDFGGTESHAFQAKFEHVIPSTMATTSTEDKNGDSSSVWKAEFQTSVSETLHGEPKSSVPSLSSPVDLSAHMDTVFGLGGEEKKDDTVPSASNTSDWFQDDLWSKSKSSVTAQVGASTSVHYDRKVESSNNTSFTSIDQIEDDQWQSSSNKGPDSKATHEHDDPFDDWNDFTSSTSAQNSSTSSLKQKGSDMTLSGNQTSEINLFSSTNNFQDSGFGSFLQQDPFSGGFSNQNGSGATILQSEMSVSNRIADTYTNDERNAEEVGKGKDAPEEITSSKADDVELLMSQMHDLSFMLESNLSIPPK